MIVSGPCMCTSEMAPPHVLPCTPKPSRPALPLPPVPSRSSLQCSSPPTPPSAPPPETLTHVSLHRRQLLRSAILLPAVSSFVNFHALSATAQQMDDDLKAKQLQEALMMSSNVIPALSLPQYSAKIDQARPLAWEEITNNIEDGKFKLQSDLLVLAPFDDLRWCCFYIPFVLIRTDAELALQTRLAYNEFMEEVKYFDSRLLSANRKEIDEAEVYRALDGMSAALDRFLALVPRDMK